MNDFCDILNRDEDGFVNRRDVLKAGLMGAAVASVPLIGVGDAQARTRHQSWRVSFKQAHTGETFNGVYRVGNRYLPEAFERLNYVMRDFRTGEVFPMDPRVIDILSMIQTRTQSSDPIHILSAYRSPKTNSSLRKASSGVAKNSFHMYGQALDLRKPGTSTKKLRNIAKSLKAGGVGYYARSGFIHIDTGTVRSW
ncbi:MAG: YcbK family protein [Bdellovibrionales bacterium]